MILHIRAKALVHAHVEVIRRLDAVYEYFCKDIA